MNELLRNILADLRVETLDEFDRNFARKAFFNKPWPERRAPEGLKYNLKTDHNR